MQGRNVSQYIKLFSNQSTLWQECCSKIITIRSFSPDIRSITPDIRLITPDIRSISPDIRSITPDIRLITPDIRSITPDARTTRNLSETGSNTKLPNFPSLYGNVNGWIDDLDPLLIDLSRIFVQTWKKLLPPPPCGKICYSHGRPKTILNKKTEIIRKCRHRNKFELKNPKP